MSQDLTLMTLGAVQCVNVSVCVSEAESASQEWALTEVWWTTLTIDHKERRFCLHERALCYICSAVDDSQADITDLVWLWVGSHALRQQLTAHALMETKRKLHGEELEISTASTWFCSGRMTEWCTMSQWGIFRTRLSVTQKLFENSIKGVVIGYILKGIVYLKTKTVIYAPSRCYRLSLFSGAQNETFWRMFMLLLYCNNGLSRSKNSKKNSLNVVHMTHGQYSGAKWELCAE